MLEARRAGWRATLAHLARNERGMLIALALTVGGLLAFVGLADEVFEGETLAFDQRVMLAMRSSTDLGDPLGPLWFEEMMRDITALGSTVVLVSLTLIAVVMLVLSRRRLMAVAVSVSIVGGMLLSQALKWGFDRARPDLVPHGAAVYTQSFPSGHAMLSAVVFLTLAALVARTQELRGVRIFLMATAIVLTLMVGTSRVYLGVHWPTDVLAGWALGAAWAIACQLMVVVLQGRGVLAPQHR